MVQGASKSVFAVVFACQLLRLGAAQAQLPGDTPEARPHVVTRAPAVVHQVDPIYPDAAKAGHLAGDVTLQVDIGIDGKVTQAVVLKGAGNGFDEAALAAVKQFVFSPAEIDGQPAAVQIEYTEHFAYVAPPPESAPPTPSLPISLQGRVIERASRVPIEGAAVRVRVGTLALDPVVTDVQGHFEVAAPAGDATVEVDDVAHQPFTTQEHIAAGEQLQATYYLMPKTFGDFETVVHGQREKKEVTRHTLQREELQSVPGSFGDPLRVLQDLPGLARTPYSVGGLIIRGAAAFDTGTYFDGVQLPLIYHFGAGPSVVNGEFLDRIDFYPGGFGARYGRAIGGIVDVDSRAAKSDGIHGSAKVDLIDAALYASVPINDEMTLSLAGRRSYVDAVLKIVLAHANTSTTIVPVYYDYQARFDYRPKALPRHGFKLFFMGSDDVLSVVSSPSSGPAFQISDHQGFQRLSGQWSYHHDNLTMKLLAFFGFDETSVGLGLSKIDSPSTVAGLRQDTEITLHPLIALRVGVDWQLRRQGVGLSIAAPLNYDPFPGALASQPLQEIQFNVDQYNFAEWLEVEAKTSFGLSVIPSLRVDVFHYQGQTLVEPQPRLIVRQELHLAPYATILKGSVGLYSELAPPQDLSPTYGNPKLPPQKAVQTSLGAEQRLTSTLSVDVTGFWSYRSDLAVATPTVNVDPDGTVRPEFYAATAIGDAYGLEVFIRQELTKQFFGWVAYTLSWSKQRDTPGAVWYYTAFDERHILTILGQYRFGNGWQAGGRFRWVTSAPSTPVTAATYAADRQAYNPVDGAAGSVRGPSFNQLDLRVDKIWLFDTWQIGAYIDVQNVYNRQNQDFVQYDYRYKGHRSIPDIPLLPTLGVKGVF